MYVCVCVYARAKNESAGMCCIFNITLNGRFEGKIHIWKEI